MNSKIYNKLYDRIHCRIHNRVYRKIYRIEEYKKIKHPNSSKMTITIAPKKHFNGS